jgi:hypothetical protein
MRPRTLLGAAALAAISIAVGFCPWMAAEPEETRATMKRIFESIRVLLPLSVRDEEFRDPAKEAEIRRALGDLASNASALAQHADGAAPEFRFLGGSLERDALETLRMYESGRFESAEFFLHQLTEYCVACHTRLPSSGDSPLAESFVDRTSLARLPPVERSKLEIATRQFDHALSTLETLFGSPSVSPATLLGPLTDYLVVCVRVKGDLERPVPALERFARRPDLWASLRSDVEHWLEVLREIGGRPIPADLATARAFVDRARREISFPTDRRALVHYVVASSALHRFIESHPARDADLAEAYYLLGLTESRIGRDYWVSQADFYLETAIRTAPREASARQAFALLEEETILGHTGSAGTHVPEEVQARLDELRRLVDED